MVVVERAFQRAMDGKGNLPECFLDPWFFRDADPVLTGDGTAILQNPSEENVERGVSAFPDLRIPIVFNNQVCVDIAVASMAEACNGDTAFLLQHTGKLYELDQLSARDDYILV